MDDQDAEPMVAAGAVAQDEERGEVEIEMGDEEGEEEVQKEGDL